MGWHRSLSWLIPSKWNGWGFLTIKVMVEFLAEGSAIPWPFCPIDPWPLCHILKTYTCFFCQCMFWEYDKDLYEFEGSLYGLIFCTTKHEKWRKQQVGAGLKTKARFKSISVWKTQVNRVVYFTFMCTERVSEFWWFLLTLYKVILQYLGLKDTIRPRKMQAKPRKIIWDLFVGMCYMGCVWSVSQNLDI